MKQKTMHLPWKKPPLHDQKRRKSIMCALHMQRSLFQRDINIEKRELQNDEHLFNKNGD